MALNCCNKLWLMGKIGMWLSRLLMLLRHWKYFSVTKKGLGIKKTKKELKKRVEELKEHVIYLRDLIRIQI